MTKVSRTSRAAAEFFGGLLDKGFSEVGAEFARARDVRKARRLMGNAIDLRMLNYQREQLMELGEPVGSVEDEALAAYTNALASERLLPSGGPGQLELGVAAGQPEEVVALAVANEIVEGLDNPPSFLAPTPAEVRAEVSEYPEMLRNVIEGLSGYRSFIESE